MLFNPTSLEINVCSTSTFALENDLKFSLGYPEIFGWKCWCSSKNLPVEVDGWRLHQELQTIRTEALIPKMSQKTCRSSFHGANQGGFFQYESYYRCKGHDGLMTISYKFLFIAILFMEVFHCREVSWWFISTISPWSLTICGGEITLKTRVAERVPVGQNPLQVKQWSKELLLKLLLLEAQETKDKEQNSLWNSISLSTEASQVLPSFFLPGLPALSSPWQPVRWSQWVPW